MAFGVVGGGGAGIAGGANVHAVRRVGARSSYQAGGGGDGGAASSDRADLTAVARARPSGFARPVRPDSL
ncbi:hypothetical protein DZF91_01975 [Actinomadura logoneensis]|uniref:Uncharacterized protein n=1 Tax=Actinomadura logoneensis TaxID=2293572 RepID=A0A372JTE7_9ACTN|nr:hypothetical protein DZF91_01975 [Actinomadura logoneensis]